MPLSLFVPSLICIRPPPDITEGWPHPLHACIEPLLLSLRAAGNKYHNEPPQILADGGGAGEAEETITSTEKMLLLEDRWRSGWLKRMEQREVQIQILLYFLKLSLRGPSTPLQTVEVPPTGNILPLVFLMDTSRTHGNRHENERDWMQRFCEDVVEPLFKSKLPEQCTTLRSKLSLLPLLRQTSLSWTIYRENFPRFPCLLSITVAGQQSAATTNAPARNHSLSVSLAQEKEKERAETCRVRGRGKTGTDVKAPAAPAKHVIGHADSQCQCQSRALPAITLVTATPIKKPPPHAKSNASVRSSNPMPIARSFEVTPHQEKFESTLLGDLRALPLPAASFTPLDSDDDDFPSTSVPILDSPDIMGNTQDEGEDSDEIWLPKSSPKVLLLGKSG
ncbi:hypothetical protein DFH29DRAFT_874756 [Suillus ampliporus]|nr:hypothetical protein DFH29DRAFT_874756 [Suillus ampliporus]